MKQTGSVLIITLWTLFFLSALALAVGAHVSANIELASRIKLHTTAQYIAKAGIYKSMADISYDTNGWDSINELWSDNKEGFKNVEIGNGSYNINYVYLEAEDHKASNYGLLDEERKININEASPDMLRVLMRKIGDSDNADDLTSAVTNYWQAKKAELLTEGNINGYYKFELLHELLLVEGIDYDLFLKLEPYITIYGSGRVNINTASSLVLLCVAETGIYGRDNPEVCKSLISKIINARNNGYIFKTLRGENLKDLVSFSLSSREAILFLEMLGHLSVRSTCFGGIATAGLYGRDIDDSVIAFVFNRDKSRLLYWNEK